MFEVINKRTARKSTGELPLPPIAGAQEQPPSPQQYPFTILVKVIDDACCQIECVEPTVSITPAAVSIILCQVVNIRTIEASIAASGIVAVRIAYDLIVVWVDSAGGLHTVSTTFDVPPAADPAKLVSLHNGSVSTQVVVEVTASVDTCMLEQDGTVIHCVIFFDMCIKIGHEAQLVVEAELAPRPDECTVVESECPPPGSPPLRITRRLFK